MKNFLFILVLISLVSCSDKGTVNISNDKIVIEKDIIPSGSQQILESSSGIRVIIPGGALNSNQEIKIVKLSNPPKINNTNCVLGSNVFQLSFKNVINFKDKIELRIKYQKSKIKAGLTSLNGIKGLIFKNNHWINTEFLIDNSNEEIVFEIGKDSQKNLKNLDVLLDKNDIIIGDAYLQSKDTTENDTTSNITFPYSVTDFDFNMMMECLSDISDTTNIYFIGGQNNGSEIDLLKPEIKWNGNKFEVKISKSDTIMAEENIFDFIDQVDCILTGEIKKSEQSDEFWEIYEIFNLQIKLKGMQNEKYYVLEKYGFKGFYNINYDFTIDINSITCNNIQKVEQNDNKLHMQFSIGWSDVQKKITNITGKAIVHRKGVELINSVETPVDITSTKNITSLKDNTFIGFIFTLEK